MLVIADGVGGWNELGIDPSAYSKAICQLIADNFQKIETESTNNQKPINITESMMKQLIAKSVRQNKNLGSSTVCVLILDKVNNELISGYLGDSCYLIARPKSVGNFELVFKSEEQTHGFNIPFQVGSEGDNPNTAVILKHKLEKNDLIIAATDGLWDNMEIEDILKEINSVSKKSNTIYLNTHFVAKNISERAEELSRDVNHYSPFAKRAIEYKYKNFFGGKPDDITVIVAQVLNEGNNDNESSSLSKKKSLCAGAASQEILNSTMDTTEDVNLITGSDGSY